MSDETTTLPVKADDGQAPAKTLAGRLAAFFRARPGQWIDGRTLGTIAGAYAWRTRIADLRRPPFLMGISNRLRRVRTTDGRAFVISEYCYRPDDRPAEGAAAGASTSAAAV